MRSMLSLKNLPDRADTLKDTQLIATSSGPLGRQNITLFSRGTLYVSQVLGFARIALSAGTGLAAVLSQPDARGSARSIEFSARRSTPAGFAVWTGRLRKITRPGSLRAEVTPRRRAGGESELAGRGPARILVAYGGVGREPT